MLFKTALNNLNLCIYIEETINIIVLNNSAIQYPFKSRTSTLYITLTMK